MAEQVTYYNPQTNVELVKLDSGQTIKRVRTTPKPATATTAPTASAPTDIYSWAQEQTDLGQQILKSQEKERQALFGQYTAASQAQEPLQAAYTRLGTEAGVPELEKTIGGFKTNIADVQNRLNQLESNINERIKGQDVSEAQRQRIIGYEATPLTKQLGELGTAMAPYTEQLSGAQSKIATQLGLISQDQQKALQPLIMQIDSISDRFAREITMYNAQKETTLTALMDKLTRERQLADREWQQAQDLAAEERKWAQTKEQLALEFSYDAKLKGMTGGGGGGGGGGSSAAETTVNKIDRAIQQAIWGGKYTATGEAGKSSREQLIKDIYDDVDADYRVIADRVYRLFRGTGEPAYGGLPADWRL